MVHINETDPEPTPPEPCSARLGRRRIGAFLRIFFTVISALFSLALFIFVVICISTFTATQRPSEGISQILDRLGMLFFTAIACPILSAAGLGFATVVKVLGNTSSRRQLWVAVAVTLWSLHGCILGWVCADLIETFLFSRK